MKKKVFRQKYGINNDGTNFGRAKVIKDATEVINIKEDKPKKKKKKEDK